jgi:hypothetical protein
MSPDDSRLVTPPSPKDPSKWMMLIVLNNANHAQNGGVVEIVTALLNDR